MQVWIAVEDRDFTFRVPRTSASGLAVEVLLKTLGPMHGPHVRTDDDREVYFELISHPSVIDHRRQYESQKQHILERFEGAVVSGSIRGASSACPRVAFASRRQASIAALCRWTHRCEATA